MPKNLPFASVHIGVGELLIPVTDQQVIVWRFAASPTSRVVSLSAWALPPGSNSSVRPGVLISRSMKSALVSIVPPKLA